MQVLPKFSKKSTMTGADVKSSQEKSIATEKSTTSEQEVTSTIKKGKKPNIEEDHKVLLRDVSVLKKDFETLKGRIDKLELLPMASSTPTKTPVITSAQDDGSKKKPNDHRGVTTIATLPHYTGYGQQDPVYRQHNPVYRQLIPAYRQHDPDGNRQYTSYTRYRQPDAGETTIPHDYRRVQGYIETDTTYNYYPTDDNWPNSHYEDQYSYEEEQSEYSNSSASYGSGADYRIHNTSKSDHYRMASAQNQLEKQSSSASTTTTTSLSLLKNNSYLESIKLQSSSIKNFAAKLNCEVFSREERIKSNVAGTHGKEKLDVNKIAAIKEATFTVYPTDIRHQVAVWRDCIKAIDEINRRIYRKV